MALIQKVTRLSEVNKEVEEAAWSIGIRIRIVSLTKEEEFFCSLFFIIFFKMFKQCLERFYIYCLKCGKFIV